MYFFYRIFSDLVPDGIQLGVWAGGSGGIDARLVVPLHDGQRSSGRVRIPVLWSQREGS